MKKFLAIVLALACVLSLCACGGNGGSAGNGGSGEGENNNVTPEGKVKLSIGLPSSALVMDHVNNSLTEWVEEQCNVELSFIEYPGGTDVATQISTNIAARQELPDILLGVALNETALSRYGQDGYFLDLSDYYADKDGLAKNFWDRIQNELSEYDQNYVLNKITDAETGAIYCVPMVETSPIDKQYCQIYINQTWLDKLSLKAPTNNEELVAVLKEFRDKDPNGNGVADEIPFMGAQSGALGSKPVDWLINLFCYYNTSRKFNVGKDGKLYPVFTTDEYREALKFVHMLNKEGLISPIVWTTSGSELKAITTPASGTTMVGMFAGHLSGGVTNNNELMYEYVPLKTWGNVQRSDISCSTSTYITEYCENPEKAFEVLMTLWSWEGSMRSRYGVYGVNWTDADPGAKSMLGLDAQYKIITDALGTQNTCLWSKMCCFNYCAERETAQLDERMSEWDKKKNELLAEHYKLFVEAEETTTDLSAKCPLLTYTQEEKDAMSMYSTNVSDYALDAKTDFSTGTLDPNDDAVWKAYLDKLEELGLSEYLRYVQIAYDRQA